MPGDASDPSSLRTARSQRIVHRPTPMMSRGSPVKFAIACRLAAVIESHRSSSGCSTIPFRGRFMGRRACLLSLTMIPSRSWTTTLELCEPPSTPMMYLPDIELSLLFLTLANEVTAIHHQDMAVDIILSLIHISEPTRLGMISY